MHWPVNHTEQETQRMLLFIVTNYESTWAATHKASLPPTVFICSTSSALAFSDLQSPAFRRGWSTASAPRGNPCSHPVVLDRNPNISGCVVPPLSQWLTKMLLRGQISTHHDCTLIFSQTLFHITLGMSQHHTHRRYHVGIMAQNQFL